MQKDYSAGSTEKIARYVEQEFHPEDDLLREVKTRTERAGLPMIQVGAMDGLHLEVLCRALAPRKAVEIGTLAGYSGIRLARGLQKGGKLHTFELDPRHAEVARESFARAGVSELVEIHVAPALEALPSIEREGPFDLVFIDADKVGYPKYLEWAERNLRVGGIVIADNTFAWGMIADETFDSRDDEEAVLALRAFNHAVSHGPRWRATLLPTGEGLTIAVKIDACADQGRTGT